MGIPIDQFNEMKARTEKARKKPISKFPDENDLLMWESELEKAGWVQYQSGEWSNPATQEHYRTATAYMVLQQPESAQKRGAKEAAMKKPVKSVFVQSASGNESWHEDAPSRPIITPVENDIINRLNEQKAPKGFCVHSAPGEGRCPITDRGCKGQAGSVRLVLDFWASEGVPRPHLEWKFCDDRKFKMDFAWPFHGFVFLEVQGALFGTGKPCPMCGQRKAGRHTRGPALLNEHEKINLATELDWRPLFCTPQELLTVKLTQTIKRALKI